MVVCHTSISRAYTVNSILTDDTNLRTEQQLGPWKYLRDTSFPRLRSNRVIVLIECDTSDAR